MTSKQTLLSVRHSPNKSHQTGKSDALKRQKGRKKPENQKNLKKQTSPVILCNPQTQRTRTVKHEKGKHAARAIPGKREYQPEKAAGQGRTRRTGTALMRYRQAAVHPAPDRLARLPVGDSPRHCDDGNASPILPARQTDIPRRLQPVHDRHVHA